MTVRKILEQLTPERIKEELAGIQAVELPEDLQKWVKEYEKVGDRPSITWKAFLKAEESLNYFSVPIEYKGSLDEIKFLFAIFTVLVDDVADKWQNKKILNEINKLLFNSYSSKSNELSKREADYLRVTLKIWNRIKDLMREAPRFNDFITLFEYDVKQMINAMDYDLMLNNCPTIVNIPELWLYSPHSMQFLFITSINLMFLSSFKTEELGLVREINWLVQKMARIGNWIYTWEREVKEKDFTSGVIAYVIQSEDISLEFLQKASREDLDREIEKMKITQRLQEKWEKYHYKLQSLIQKTTTINIPKLIAGMERLLVLEGVLAQYK